MGIKNKYSRENIKNYLLDALEAFKKDYKIERCFVDEDFAIDLICDFDKEYSKEIISKSCYAFCLLKYTTDSPSVAFSQSKNTIWYVDSLLYTLSKITTGKGKKYLLQISHKTSFRMSLIGFGALYLLCATRYELYLREKNTLDYVYAYLAPKYGDDSPYAPKIANSYKRLGLSALKKYNGMVNKDNRLFPIQDEIYEKTSSPERLFYSHIHEYLRNTFPRMADFVKQAENGGKEIYSTAKAAARDVRDINKVYEKHTILVEPSKLMPRTEEDAERLNQVQSVNDIYDLLLTWEIYNGAINPIDKEILILYYEGYNFRDMVEMLPIKRSAVHERLTKLALTKEPK